METKKIIVVLLVIAILFSAISIILNVSLNKDFKPVSSESTGEGVSGNLAGNINLVVESPGDSNE